MKKRCKILALAMIMFVISIISVSCDKNRELNKASKNLSKYTISAELDDDLMTVEANQEVKFINKYDVALDKICFNLYGKAFRENATIKPFTTLNEGKCFPNGLSYGDLIINSVLVDNEKTSYSIVGKDENALEVSLKNKLEPKQSVNVIINFKLELPECVHRLGYYAGHVNLGNWFPILAKYEKGEFIIEPYYSTGDPFFSDIANFNVEFKYSSDYSLFSTGEVKNQKCKDSVKIDKIYASAVRDFAIFLSKENLTKSKKIEDTTVFFSGYNQDENVDRYLNVSVKAVNYFNKTFGAYPYESLEVVKAPFIHGGMEYPGVVIISDNITNDFDIIKVIVHEIAHQWWYAVVGNNEIKEAWLDESLAEFSTILFLANHKEFDVTYDELISESFANYVLFADIVKSLNKQINTSMLLPVNEYNSEYEYTYMIYVRGVLMLDSVNNLVGEKNLIKTLKKYYSKYKFKIATTDDFIALSKSVSKKNIDVVFDSWLSGKTIVGNLNNWLQIKR